MIRCNIRLDELRVRIQGLLKDRETENYFKPRIPVNKLCLKGFFLNETLFLLHTSTAKESKKREQAMSTFICKLQQVYMKS